MICNEKAGVELRALFAAHEMITIKACINNSARSAIPGVRAALQWLHTLPKELFVIWGHHSDSHRWLSLTLALAKRDFVVVEQLVPGSRLELRNSRLTIPLKRFVAKRARAVVLNGYSQVEHYRKLFNLPDVPIAVIPNSRPILSIHQRVLDLRSARSELRKSLGLRERITLLCVGRLTAQKDQATILTAMGEVKNDAQIVLVGEGPARGQLEEIAARLPSGTVVFAGYQSDALPWLAAADIFILPSLYEGLPGALIEAMAAELPCISTDIPGNRELVRDNETGLLVKVRSASAIAVAVSRLISDNGLTQRLAVAGFRHVRDSYAEEIEKAGWQQLFTGCLNRKVPDAAAR